MYSVLQKKCNMGWEIYNLKSCTHFKGYKRTLESVLILSPAAYTPEHPKYHTQVLPQAMQKNWQKGRLRERRAREGNRSRGRSAGFCRILFFSLLKRCPSRIRIYLNLTNFFLVEITLKTWYNVLG